MVSELIEQPGQWNKDLIHQVFSTPDSQLILSIPITLFEHDDDWLWHFTSHGHYSVKSGYNLAIGGEILQPSSSNEVMAAWCSSYWAIEISKKKLHFGWKVVYFEDIAHLIVIVLYVVSGMIPMHMQFFGAPSHKV
ncbi:hypothetical protein G4B88_013583 [Cannabis sativa]|uniref:Uncharacterized protein n=1 Tax=Cannabis sativa TaxID=3483 RepID=A0A7J6F1C7_CANSA|nr:hypothetical protein G4B88_013583 [Cannabis sativa]